MNKSFEFSLELQRRHDHPFPPMMSGAHKNSVLKRLGSYR